MAATAAGGQESGLKPAMFNYDRSPAWTPTAARADLAANPSSSIPVPCLQYEYPAAGLKPERLNIAAFSLDAPREELNGDDRHNWLQLVQKKSAGWVDFWEHIEAGYGQFCRLESRFGNNTWELERPSCSYLRARFSF